MAEQKKERKVVAAGDAPAKKKTTVNAKGQTVKPAKPVGNPGPLRAGAVICWILAIACEVVGFLMYFGKINITFAPTLACIIAVIVVDLIFVIVGAQLWKKANHIDPASSKNKVKFFLWNNMGVIACIIAFLPYIILILTDKEHKLDKNTRIIAAIAAIVALLIGCVTGVDWNPVSQEELSAAEQYVKGEVCWTPFGHVYHYYYGDGADDFVCPHLNNSDTIIHGDVDQAIAASKTRLCKTCANREGITGVATTDD